MGNRPVKEDLVVKITLIDHLGLEMLGYTRCLVSLMRVIQYINKHNGKMNRFIFPNMMKENCGPNLFRIRSCDVVQPYKIVHPNNMNVGNICGLMRNDHQLNFHSSENKP